MPMKDYYVVLGVSRTEGAEEIRDAFRDLARRYHPDRAGPRSTRQFQQITEAYHVLSDADRRAAYDRGLARRDGSAGAESAPVRNTAPRASGVAREPLIPERATPLREVVDVRGPPDRGAPDDHWVIQVPLRGLGLSGTYLIVVR